MAKARKQAHFRAITIQCEDERKLNVYNQYGAAGDGPVNFPLLTELI